MGILESCRQANASGDASDLQCRCIDAAAEIERLRVLLFKPWAMTEAPCFCCGYNGQSYYQPGTHPCAALHHALQQHSLPAGMARVLQENAFDLYDDGSDA